MRVIQSSSLRLMCALVLPAILSNALPQSLDKRQSSNLVLTLYGNEEGEMTRNVQEYPEVELIPQRGTSNKYDVVGKWRGDGRSKAAAAIKERSEENWARTVRSYIAGGQLMAAGNDGADPPTWWVIVSTGEDSGQDNMDW